MKTRSRRARWAAEKGGSAARDFCRVSNIFGDSIAASQAEVNTLREEMTDPPQICQEIRLPS